jgi:hypothetical protein
MIPVPQGDIPHKEKFAFLQPTNVPPPYPIIAIMKTGEYIVCPKSNATDFFAQPRMTRTGKW